MAIRRQPSATRNRGSPKSPVSLLDDLGNDTVDFRDNYDGQLQEPSVLPAKFPNLLVNGAGGIAVGMATNIPPHNLGEIIDACMAELENPEITIDELCQIVTGPDFPTGAIILGRGGILRPITSRAARSSCAPASRSRISARIAKR